MSYDKIQIASGYMKEIAAKLSVAQLISLEQLALILTNFKTTFYTPSFFVRIGLFIFTLILINSAIGIIAIFTSDFLNSEMAYGVLLLTGGACLIGVLEYFIHKKLHYKSGIDDCLLFSAVSFLIAGLVLTTHMYDVLQVCLLAFPVLLIAAWRYADSVVALFAFCCFFISVCLTLKNYSFGRQWMPFIFFGISGILTFLFNYWLKKDGCYYYDTCLKVLKVAALLTLYLSMNYFVVKEGNLLLNEVPQEGGFSEAAQEIPFAFLFLGITFLIPWIYIYLGLKEKDRLLLWTGLAVLLVTVLTFKYRFHLLAYEYTMTYCGLFMVIGSWFIIRSLRKSPGRYTFKRELSGSLEHVMNAEALIISQTLGHDTGKVSGGTEFGGGGFGGGGAGGSN